MTKILATAGPASSSGQALRALIHAGVDAFRLNFSHGTAAQHFETCHRIRSLSRSLGKPVAILQDLAGPKMRVGEMAEGEALLYPDSEVTITTRSVLGTSLRFSTSYKRLPRDAEKGNTILLDDGLISLEVTHVKDQEVLCRVTKGGTLRSHKGMNLPNTNIRTPAITTKDRKDLAEGMAVGMDYVALSFVRSPDDIHQLRRLLKKGGSKAWVIAKIERPEAVRRIDEILDAADGIMVARGDLGVEMQIEKVPLLQKDLIRRANRADKLVITATQMLESMILHPVPTRAEVSDIANAIIDGTDAVMLSGETSVGQYPVRAVEIMVRIIQETENLLASSGPYPVWDHVNPGDPVLDTLGHATRRICSDLHPAAICTESEEGRTALFLSKSRPFIPIVTFSEHDETLRRLGLFWGIVPVRKGRVTGRERLFRAAVEITKRKGLAHSGDYLVLVTGKPERPRFLGSIDILTVPRND